MGDKYVYKLNQTGENVQKAINQIVSNGETDEKLLVTDSQGGITYIPKFKSGTGINIDSITNQININTDTVPNKHDVELELSEKQLKSNLINSFGETFSTQEDTKYPSAKLLKNYVKSFIEFTQLTSLNEIKDFFNNNKSENPNSFKDNKIYLASIENKPCIFEGLGDYLFIISGDILYSYQKGKYSHFKTYTLSNISKNTSDITSINKSIDLIRNDIGSKPQEIETSLWENIKILNDTVEKVAPGKSIKLSEFTDDLGSNPKHTHKKYDPCLKLIYKENPEIIDFNSLYLQIDNKGQYSWNKINPLDISFENISGDPKSNLLLKTQLEELDSKNLDSIADGTTRKILKSITINGSVKNITSDSIDLGRYQTEINKESNITVNNLTSINKISAKTLNISDALSSSTISGKLTCGKSVDVKEDLNAKKVTATESVTAKLFDGSLKYLTEEPKVDNPDGSLKVVVLKKAPSQKFNNYLYIILDKK